MAKKIPKATEDPTTTVEETPSTEALKVIITLKDGRGSIGVQKAGCDPFLLSLPDAGLTNAIARLPEALVEAHARWREQRQYPEYTRPAPPPAPVRPAATRATRAAPPTSTIETPRMF